MLEYRIVKLVLLSGSHFNWTLHVEYIPEFVHILPESTLHEIKKQLSFQTLVLLDSNKLSTGQVKEIILSKLMETFKINIKFEMFIHFGTFS